MMAVQTFVPSVNPVEHDENVQVPVLQLPVPPGNEQTLPKAPLGGSQETEPRRDERRVADQLFTSVWRFRAVHVPATL